MARFKRREFIRDTALLGVGSLLGGQRALAAVGADYDVVIIGAGMAGTQSVNRRPLAFAIR